MPRTAGSTTASTSIIPPSEIKSVDEVKAMRINHKRLILEATKDDDTCKDWLASHGLIANERKCGKCGLAMRFYSEKIKDGYRWRCLKCKTSLSFRAESFFSGSHLTVSQIVEFLYFWTLDVPHHVIRRELEVGETNQSTTVDWANFVRDVCAAMVEGQTGVQIGGVGKVVEVDESVFFKRKYQRGQVREHVWVLGGVERDGSGAFMEVVADRKAATLLEVIERRVAPGTTVFTDSWASYGSLQQRGFAHDTVNHSLNFVKPGDADVHTQTIEGFWSHAKKKYRRMNGTSAQLFQTYIPEFLVRRAVPADALFGTILAAIRDKYTFT